VREWHEEGFPIKRMMKILGITRSMYYYYPAAKSPEGEAWSSLSWVFINQR